HPQIAKRADLQNAKTAKKWRPQVFPYLPVRVRKILIVVAFAAFKHKDAISLLCQAHRRNASPKARADHHKIKRLSDLLARHTVLSSISRTRCKETPFLIYISDDPARLGSRHFNLAESR